MTMNKRVHVLDWKNDIILQKGMTIEEWKANIRECRRVLAWYRQNQRDLIAIRKDKTKTIEERNKAESERRRNRFTINHIHILYGNLRGKSHNTQQYMNWDWELKKALRDAFERCLKAEKRKRSGLELAS